MSYWSVSRIVAVAPLLSLTTGYRMGATQLRVWSERSPELIGLWLEAWEPAPEAQGAASALHEKLIATAHEATRKTVDELERGIDQLDAWTRPSSVDASGPSK